jgi:hypothetical protein
LIFNLLWEIQPCFPVILSGLDMIKLEALSSIPKLTGFPLAWDERSTLEGRDLSHFPDVVVNCTPEDRFFCHARMVAGSGV